MRKLIITIDEDHQLSLDSSDNITPSEYIAAGAGLITTGLSYLALTGTPREVTDKIGGDVCERIGVDYRKFASGQF